MSRNHNHQEDDSDRQAYKRYRREQRRKAAFWLWVATLIIIPFSVILWIQYDQYAHSLEYQGCKVVNVFETGSKVYSCPPGVK